jgi:hypothetical protein
MDILYKDLDSMSRGFCTQGKRRAQLTSAGLGPGQPRATGMAHDSTFLNGGFDSKHLRQARAIRCSSLAENQTGSVPPLDSICVTLV